MKTESLLEDYQIVAKNHIINNPFCALFLDMGLGKTISTLTAIRDLFFDLDITSVLVIAPKRISENVWTDECEEWEHIQGFKVSVVAGTEQERKAALKEKAHIYTIGVNNIAWLCAQYGGSKLPFDMCVIDESSCFKNHKSVRFTALRMVQPFFKRIVLLTGTPAPNGLIDLWAQLYLLDRGERLGPRIGEFRRRYFDPDKSKGHIVYSYKSKGNLCEKEIHAKIGDICISMNKKDYLDIPGVVHNKIKVNLGPALQERYREFEEEKVLEMFGDGKEVYAVNAAALTNKLLQFSSGAVYDANKDYHYVHDLKIQALEEILEINEGRNFIIAWSFKHARDRIMSKLKKYKPVELKGGETIRDWNAGKTRMLLMHPASGGHGLNLQSGGNNIVWFDQVWSSELYQQLIARLDRKGKTETTFVHNLICPNTMDVDVVRALGSKKKKEQSLLDAVKVRINKYVK